MKNPELRFNFQQIVLYGYVRHTQNPRVVDLEPSPNRGSD